MPLKRDILTFSPEAIFRERAKRSKRTGKLGRSRFTIEAEGESLLFNFSERAIGAPVIKAIEEALRQKVESIRASVKPSTLAAREQAVRSFRAGARWAKRRYSGGRIGATPPQSGERRMFNFSGRFAQSIKAGFKQGGYVINVAANRDFGKGLPRMISQLVSVVPEFGDPNTLIRSPAVRNSLEEAASKIATKAAKGEAAMVRELAKLTKQVMELVRLVAGV